MGFILTNNLPFAVLYSTWPTKDGDIWTNLIHAPMLHLFRHIRLKPVDTLSQSRYIPRYILLIWV
jgi:hypothetical protein